MANNNFHKFSLSVGKINCVYLMRVPGAYIREEIYLYNLLHPNEDSKFSSAK